jgi:hypothetical protein
MKYSFRVTNESLGLWPKEKQYFYVGLYMRMQFLAKVITASALCDNCIRICNMQLLTSIFPVIVVIEYGY